MINKLLDGVKIIATYGQTFFLIHEMALFSQKRWLDSTAFQSDRFHLFIERRRQQQVPQFYSLSSYDGWSQVFSTSLPSSVNMFLPLIFGSTSCIGRWNRRGRKKSQPREKHARRNLPFSHDFSFSPLSSLSLGRRWKKREWDRDCLFRPLPILLKVIDGAF